METKNRTNIYVTSLAWQELYKTFGTLFRRFEFKLYETDITDVEMKHDFFIPRVKLDSKGVRLTVSGAKK